jgi:hypothetical protein
LIYFAQPIDGGPVKIGCSDDVPARVRQLEAHYGKPLAVLATMEGGYEEEQSIHARFDHLRFGRTEQFRPGADLMAFIGRPLLVGANPDAVEAMEPKGQVSVIHLQGPTEEKDWLTLANKKTHLPKATIVRLALAEWGASQGLPPYPNRGDDD